MGCMIVLIWRLVIVVAIRGYSIVFMALRTKKLQPSEAWYCLTATIMKTIEYPLMASTMTRRQINTIMQPILQAAIRKCRIQNHLPRKLVYGTLRAWGLGLKDPFITQLIQHLQAILRHANCNTPSQLLHQENMELVQLHIGSARNFWELPFEQYGCLAPKGWMKHTWECLDSTPLSLLGPPLQINPSINTLSSSWMCLSPKAMRTRSSRSSMTVACISKPPCSHTSALLEAQLLNNGLGKGSHC